MPYTFSESGAFMERFTLEPTGSGSLNGLTFACKDLIDIVGKITGCGNPTWRETHPPASVNAICVDQLLAAGARCIGKTITDELAFSVLGENEFYGTPLNPRAPDRVPGGSSCGSVSAVACGLADFALGTDTGGSVRVPAANCGIFGFRPTHGRISVAGVNPLSPTFDTVGVFAASFDVLLHAASTLFATEIARHASPTRIVLVKEAFAITDESVRKALQPAIERLPFPVTEISIREIDRESNASELQNWYEIYRVVQRAEAESCLGAWVRSANPKFGTLIAQSFELTRTLDRQLVPPMIERRERYYSLMNSFLQPNDLLCIPTIPCPAPLKGSVRKREVTSSEYYARVLALTSIAGIARLPQITLPFSDASGLPVGLSVLGRSGEDASLLRICEGLTAKNAENAK